MFYLFLDEENEVRQIEYQLQQSATENDNHCFNCRDGRRREDLLDKDGA